MQSVGFYAVTLVGKKHEYGQVHTFRFEPESPVTFLPGQYVHLMAPNSPPGRENVRHLSIASIPEDGPLEFTIDLASATDYKKKFAALEVGGKAHLFKVKGHFVLAETPPKSIVFLAGGIGITPIRSLIRQIEKHRLPVEWRLGHVARDGFLYEEELSALGGIQSRIRRAEVEALLDTWTAERPDAAYYLSGSNRFVVGLSSLLRERGIPETAITIENFE
jgi:ferredoxin-NADP reductase